MSNGLKLFRLRNGDDIIGFLEEYSDKQIEQLEDNTEEQKQIEAEYQYDHLVFIRDPMRMVWAYDTKTQGHQLYMTKWMPFSADSLFFIPKTEIITISDPLPEVEQHYAELVDEPQNIRREGQPQLTPEEMRRKDALEFLDSWLVDKDKDKQH